MIIYEREKKTLIIPTGIGNGNLGSGDYADGYEAGKAAQKAADDRKITPTTAITQNGEYEADYGFKKVIVDVECGDCSEEVEAAYNSGYTGGYDEGLEDGAEQQKAKLESISITNNGTYSRPDGYGTVEVQVEGGTCNLESKPFNLDSGTTFPATISPSEGYDGLSEVTVQDNGYGQTKYNDGFSDGQDNIRSNMGSAVFTQNGNYSNSSGWSSVTINVPSSGGASNLQNKSVVLTAGTQTVVPDAGFDGMTEVDVDATDMLANERSNGYSQGANDVKNQFTSTAVTQNGTYQMTGEFNAFSSFTVNVPSGITAASEIKVIMTETPQRFCVGFSRPQAPSGETVYGGSYERLKWFMDNYGNVVIFSFTDQEHNDEIEEGYFANRNGQYIYYNNQANLTFPLDEIGPRWTNTGNNDKFFLWGDGMNIFFYTKYEYGWETNYVILPPENLILEVASADAASCISIDADDVYESGFTEGYNSGYTDGISSGHTEGYEDALSACGGSYIWYESSDESAVTISSYNAYTTSGNAIQIEENVPVYSANGVLPPPPVNRYIGNRIVFSDVVKVVNKMIFSQPEKITKIFFPSSMTGFLEQFGTGEFEEYNRFGHLTSLTELTLPAEMRNVVGFNDCPNLKSVNLPMRMAIMRRAFTQSGIKEVNFPKSTGWIGSDSFRGSAVEKVIINGPCYIEHGALRGDAGKWSGVTQTPSLQEIYIYSTISPIFSSDAGGTIIDPTDANAPFGGQPSGGTIYVPTGYAGIYQNWLNYLPGWTISDTL